MLNISIGQKQRNLPVHLTAALNVKTSKRLFPLQLLYGETPPLHHTDEPRGIFWDYQERLPGACKIGTNRRIRANWTQSKNEMGRRTKLCVTQFTFSHCLFYNSVTFIRCVGSEGRCVRCWLMFRWIWFSVGLVVIGYVIYGSWPRRLRFFLPFVEIKNSYCFSAGGAPPLHKHAERHISLFSLFSHYFLTIFVSTNFPITLACDLCWPHHKTHHHLVDWKCNLFYYSRTKKYKSYT